MTILLIGAAGQVGTELRGSLATLGPLVATTREGGACLANTHALDVADLEAIEALIERVRPHTVVNAAAYTAVDRAECEPDLARRINAEAPEAIATACRRIGARLVHYSTDYVFDGLGVRPYREDDATAPLGVYGATKLAGELAIVASGVDHLILRTAWVYGLHGQNFLRTMLRVGAERDELGVVDDEIGSPTPASLTAQATLHLLSHGSRPSGLFNVVSSGSTSWYGFATAIFEEATRIGLVPRQPHICAIPSSDYPTAAARPRYSVLDTTKLRATGFEPPEWRAALRQTLADSRVG